MSVKAKAAISVIVLLSGGVDSVTALYAMKEQHEIAAALSFNYGSKHNARELECARYHAQRLGVRHEIVELDFMNRVFKSDLLQSGGAILEGNYTDENMKSTVVPFRNGIMLAIAAGVAESMECGGIVIAAHAGDHAIYPDCRPGFMAAMQQAIAAGTYNNVQVLAPFIQKNKGDIVRIGHRLGVDYAHTWSCYCGGEEHCGKCGTCVERKEAFALAGVTDPTCYKA